MEKFAKVSKYYNTSVNSLAKRYLKAIMVDPKVTPLRILKGVTQKTAGKQFSAHKSTVAKWEKEESFLPVGQFAAIADYYGTTVERLADLAAKSLEMKRKPRTRFSG